MEKGGERHLGGLPTSKKVAVIVWYSLHGSPTKAATLAVFAVYKVNGNNYVAVK